MNAANTQPWNSLAASQVAAILARTGVARGGAVVHRVRPAAVPINPVITPKSTIIIVKKPHTNPARVPITLRTSAPFRQKGTLQRVTVATSGGIHIFKTKTDVAEMQFNGTDNVFSGTELSKGVQVFATADRRSGAVDDFKLTLTLTPGANVGGSITVSLTAVELTLDVGISRPSAGVPPPIMSEADKINIGRSVQVRNPGFDHERAMIVLRPPNPQIPLLVRLEALTPQLLAFGFETPDSGQQSHPRVATFTSDILTNPFELFIEATAASNAVRDTGFRYGVDGVEDNADRVAMTAVQFDVTNTANNALAATSFARFGLWDNAFSPATRDLRNGATDGTHFIGTDSRHFFFRLRDRNAGATPQIEWRTVKADGSADHAPAAQPLPLVETAPNSHRHFSRPVFLVTHDDDRDLQNSGLAAAAVPALLPRIHKVTVDDTHPIDGRLTATYSPIAGQILRAAAILFSRTPEERRRIKVHLVNVRTTVGGTGILTVARANLVKTAFQSIYATCGIFAEVDQIPLDPPASCIGWTTRYPADPLAIDPAVPESRFDAANNLQPTTEEADIIKAVRNLVTPSFDANDIYLVCVARLYSNFPVAIVAPPGPGLLRGPGGEGFTDTFTAAGSTARGFGFVGGAGRGSAT